MENNRKPFDQQRDGMENDLQPFDHEQDNPDTHINEPDELNVPVTEEELSASKREVERGSVRIEKDVVEEQQTLDVPVTEEEVNVSRRTVNRAVDSSDNAFEEETIEVPLRGEEVDLQKSVRVSEEIDIDKSSTTHNEHVGDTVRREEVTLEGDENTERRDKQGRRKKR